MSVATLHSAHIVGLEALPVTVEVDVSQGLYTFAIVGLPDKAIDESKDRIIAALKNTGLRNPKTENHKVTVSLAPAHIKKEGSHFDLPIAQKSQRSSTRERSYGVWLYASARCCPSSGWTH